MSWLEHSLPPEYDECPFCGCLENECSCPKEVSSMGSAIEKLILSRQKTVDMLTARIEEYSKQREALPVGSAARTAVGNAISLDKQRLVRVQAELNGFKDALVPDARQVPVPGTERKGR